MSLGRQEELLPLADSNYVLIDRIHFVTTCYNFARLHAPQAGAAAVEKSLASTWMKGPATVAQRSCIGGGHARRQPVGFRRHTKNIQ